MSARTHAHTHTRAGRGRRQHGALQLQRVRPARLAGLAAQRRPGRRGRGRGGGRGRGRGASAARRGARAPRRLPMRGAPRLTLRASCGRAAPRRQVILDIAL